MENKDKKEITSLADFKQVQDMYIDFNGDFYIELKDEPFKTFENICSLDRIIFYNAPNTDMLTYDLWKTMQKDCNIVVPSYLEFHYHPFGIIIEHILKASLYKHVAILYDNPNSLTRLLEVLNKDCSYNKVVHKKSIKDYLDKIDSLIDFWQTDTSHLCFGNDKKYEIQYERPRFISEIGNKIVNGDSCSTTIHLYDKDLIGDQDIDKEEGLSIDEFIASKVAKLDAYQLMDFLKFLLDLPEDDDVDVMRAKTLTKVDELLGI